MKTPFSTEVFLLFSPLITIITVIAGRAFYAFFWISLIVLGLSLIFGRYFCGWICPFGTTFDITDRLMRKVRHKEFNSKHKIHHIKYCILVILIVTAIFGLNIAGWFDPISWSTRLYGLVVHPSGYLLSDYSTAKIGWDPLRWIQSKIFHPQSGIGSFNQPYFQHALSVVAIFIGIASFGIIMRRFYCRVICPLGAVFSLLGRFAFFRRYTSDACIECGNCLRECKMGAIGEKGKGTIYGECILCFDCDTVCPVDCIYWNPALKKQENLIVTSKSLPLDFTRRELIGSILGSLAALPIIRLALATEGNRIRKDMPVSGTASNVIRPPGAPNEKKFLAKCIRCGQCMKVCPTNGLQPLLFEQGIEGLWTPTLVPRIGYCEFTCTLCMEVCPTGALELLSLEKKQRFALGKAEFNRNRCIPWTNHARWDKNPDTWFPAYHCGVCEEHCPGRDKNGEKAILLTWGDIPEQEGMNPPLPYMNTSACIGCGQCEKVCPVEGDAAVRVWRTKSRGMLVNGA